MSDIKMIFDTNCVLCSGFVHFILRHETDHDIVFVKAWSKTGLKLAAKHNLSKNELHETYLVISNGRALTRSQAGMEILLYIYFFQNQEI